MRLITTFLVASGMAALTYQVAWIRLLGLSVGSTSAAVSTVLASFFLGLAGGGFLAERLLRRPGRELRTYVVLEAVIGLSGLLLLPALLNLDRLVASVPGLATEPWFRFAVALALLIVPTVAMGATFPVMTAHLVRRQGELGFRLGQLYALNTAGAVLGAALAGSVFFPLFGLHGAIGIAVTLNLMVAVMGAVVLRRGGETELVLDEVDDTEAVDTTDDAEPDTKDAEDDGAPTTWQPMRIQALGVLLVTGFVSIAAEVGWAKVLIIFTGGTVYGVSAILTAVLLGIALGSWEMRSYLDDVERPELWFIAGLLLLGVTMHVTRLGLTATPGWFERLTAAQGSGLVQHLIKLVLVVFVLFPPTFLLGALYPLSLRVYCDDVPDLRKRLGRAQALNTLAGIAGSLLAGFLLIPRIGTDATLRYLALLVMLLPLAFLPKLSGLAQRAGAVALIALVATAAHHTRSMRFEPLITAAFNSEHDGDPQFLFLAEGKSSVISMVSDEPGQAYLFSNGFQEAWLDLEKPERGPLIEFLLGSLPSAIHPDPQNAFVIGFGGGYTTSAVTRTEVPEIRVVELEPNVVEAVKSVRGGEAPSLRDPRVQLSLDDARNVLLVEGKRYDLIVSQPSHPWLSGAGTLFTRDFFEIVSSRLTDDGIFAQWLNLWRLDATTLRSLLRAFYEVFPEGFVLQGSGRSDLLFVGSRSPLTLDRERLDRLFSREAVAEALEEQELLRAEQLFPLFGLSREEALAAAGDVAPNTDTRLYTEVRLGMLRNEAEGDEDPLPMLARHRSFDVLPFLVPEQAPDFLLAIGRNLVTLEDLDSARLAEKQLRSIAPARADELLGEIETAASQPADDTDEPTG
ncbi:MAG: fused MFS/spermidine synthase [Acidobacteriota bacterium]